MARADPDDASGEGSGFSRSVEALGYLGAALVLAALAVAAAEFWADLESWARVALLASAAVAFHVMSWTVRRQREAAIVRLTAVLWLLGTVCLAGAVGVALEDRGRLASETVALAVALVATLDAGVLAATRPGLLAQVAVLGALVVAVVSGLLHVPRIRPEAVGLSVWALGVVWTLGAWSRVVRPRDVGYSAGAGVALLAVTVIAAGEWSGWGLALGLATSAGLVAASVPAASVLLLAAGSAGAFVFVTWIAVDRFAETIGVPLTLFVVGTALVAIALGAVRLRLRYRTGGEGGRP